MIFGRDHVTTGASNDIERATEMARNMVTKWGLSDKLGPLTYQEDEGEVFLGRSMQRHREVSDATVENIDTEVRAIIDECYSDAEKILRDNMDTLHLMSKALMQYETIDEKQIAEIMSGQEPTPPEGWDEDTVDSKANTKAAKSPDQKEDKESGQKSDQESALDKSADANKS